MKPIEKDFTYYTEETMKLEQRCLKAFDEKASKGVLYDSFAEGYALSSEEERNIYMQKTAYLEEQNTKLMDENFLKENQIKELLGIIQGKDDVIKELNDRLMEADRIIGKYLSLPISITTLNVGQIAEFESNQEKAENFVRKEPLGTGE